MIHPTILLSTPDASAAAPNSPPAVADHAPVAPAKMETVDSAYETCRACGYKSLIANAYCESCGHCKGAAPSIPAAPEGEPKNTYVIANSKADIHRRKAWNEAADAWRAHTASLRAALATANADLTAMLDRCERAERKNELPRSQYTQGECRMEVPASFAETVRTYMGQRVRMKGDTKFGPEWGVVMIGLDINGVALLVVRNRNNPTECVHFSTPEVEIVTPKNN